MSNISITVSPEVIDITVPVEPALRADVGPKIHVIAGWVDTAAGDSVTIESYTGHLFDLDFKNLMKLELQPTSLLLHTSVLFVDDFSPDFVSFMENVYGTRPQKLDWLGVQHDDSQLDASEDFSMCVEHAYVVSFEDLGIHSLIDSEGEPLEIRSAKLIKFAKVAIYIQARMKNDIKYQTIIVHIDCPDLVGLAEKVLDRMENHWKQRLCRRWERLNLEPLWIFCDLFVVFEWNNTFKTLSTELGKMNKGILNQSSIIDQTQSLHKLVGITISVSENLRIQTLVAESLKKWLKKATKNPESTIACHNRIYNISQKLASHRHTADVLRQQFQNMIDLKFNMVAISQGAVVGRLSLLGFIFIPVSFVATIFGMTEFHGSPVYFPVAAFLTLIVIGGFAWPLLAPLIKTKWIGKHYEETKTRQLVIVTHRSTSMDSQTEYTDGNHFSTGAVH